MKVEPVTLSNSAVILAPLQECDREPVRAVAADPDLWRFHFLNQYARTFDRWFDYSLAQSASGAWMTFVVRDAHSGAIAGSSSYLDIQRLHRRLEIGSTWYAKAYQGGVTNPGTKLALMTHIFETLGWNRVEFKLDARNSRSWAAMRKLGAIEEGVLRQHMMLPDGHIRDSVMFSVIAPEWPRVKAGLMARIGL